MEKTEYFPSGEWNGFFLEKHQPKRGWMHLYLNFENGSITGEGTDYVGPWNISGTYDPKTGQCQWTKQYLGKHKVEYQGLAGETGIQGEWTISYVSGPFHIWPRSMGYLNELYLQEDLQVPIPGVLLGTVEEEAELLRV